MVVGWAVFFGVVGGLGYVLWKHFMGKGRGLPKIGPRIPRKPPKPKPSAELEARLEELKRLYRAGKVSEATYRRLRERYEKEAEGSLKG